MTTARRPQHPGFSTTVVVPGAHNGLTTVPAGEVVTACRTTHERLRS